MMSSLPVSVIAQHHQIVCRKVEAGGKYLLDGFCFTISSLANLILNMQDSPRFANVALKHAALKDLKKRHVYEFQVACTLEEIDDNAEGLGDEPNMPTKLGATTEDVDGALAATHDWNLQPKTEATAP